ncbi:hypothetical protein [Pseudomonas sp. dw_358]|uniref:hypothetical protein n=1 Tax=Pseudomonas sp. dw_358 TaxID=2720083 RepID=UPI001BD635E5|nr:hypothetical protein [Pseudomonas sp. dw_358]
MISLETSSIREKDADRIWLAMAMAAFEGRSGVIQVVEAAVDFKVKPEIECEVTTIPEAPDRREVMRAESFAKRLAELAERKALEDRIRALAETMTYLEAVEATGYSRAALYRISRAGGFNFRRKSHDIKKHRAYIDPTVDARMCERMIALRDVGLSRYQAAKQMEVAGTVILRLMRDYGIDFPSQKPRRCAG